jgi:hypothetical protein
METLPPCGVNLLTTTTLGEGFELFPEGVMSISLVFWFQDKISTFIIRHLFEKLAVKAIEKFLCVSTLNFSLTESSHNSPANPTAMLALIHASEILIGQSRWADTKLIFFPSAISFSNTSRKRAHCAAKQFI